MTAALPRPMTAVAAQRRLLVLSATRWLPVGLIIGLTTLLMVERGMSLGEIGLILATQGFVVLALELPTGGLADALGRRPVLILAGATAIGSAVLFLLAQTLPAFMVALALQGVYRALDSGPLEAWYVDTAYADDPGVPVERAVSLATTLLGLAIAGGALASGALVAWHPVRQISPLLLPFYLALGLNVVHLVLTALLVRELPRSEPGTRTGRVLSSVRRTPAVVRSGIQLLGSAPVLRSLVLVEVFWSVAMIAFETLHPVRLAELVGGAERAGAIIGPVSAASWGLFAIGAYVAGGSARRIGVARTAVLARLLNGAFVVAMGVATGPVGLIAAFLASYTMHGAAGPMHNALLHRQAGSDNRATVLSMNSMVAGGAYSLGLLALGPLAEYTSTATAIVVAGSFSLFGALLYLPARRQERTPVAPSYAGSTKDSSPTHAV
jgi:predicted MFS family arabinose efflux permease